MPIASGMPGASTVVGRGSGIDARVVHGVTELVQQVQYLTARVTVPVIVDADTGFGEPLSVMRTVRQFEAAGVAGLHLEDQENPKRCGHLEGKSLVSTDEMTGKLKEWWDHSGDLWESGDLAGKVGAAFTASCTVR